LGRGVYPYPFSISERKLSSIKFKYNIGDVIKDSSRELEIIDRYCVKKEKKKNGKAYYLNEKWYKYRCLKCGNEDSVIEYSLHFQNCGCNACHVSSRKTVKGVNDISTTAPWMIPYFVNPNDAFIYHKYSKVKTKFKCLDCGRVYEKSIGLVNANHGVACACSDGWSYPNKFMYFLLEQIGVNFTPEKIFDWSKNRIYDDYIEYNGLKIITEQHGNQHYDRPIHHSRSLEQEKENDKLKRDLALNNGIGHYFVIDCRESSKEYIKKNICKSGLLELLDVNQDDIDWEQCSVFASSNIVKAVCNFLNENPSMAIDDVAAHFKFSKKTIFRYQRLGKQNGWIKYSNRKQLLNKPAYNSKPVYCHENGNYYGSAFVACECMFSNATEGSAKRLKVCIGRNITYKDHNFSFVTQEEFNRVKSESPEKCFGDFFNLKEDKHD